MSNPAPTYSVAILHAGGEGDVTTFETYQKAVEYADLPRRGESGGRARILRLRGGEQEILGVRGAGQESDDLVQRFYVAPREGGPMAFFDSYKQARDYAEAGAASGGPDSSGMLLFALRWDGHIVVEQFPGRPGPPPPP